MENVRLFSPVGTGADGAELGVLSLLVGVDVLGLEGVLVEPLEPVPIDTLTGPRSIDMPVEPEEDEEALTLLPALVALLVVLAVLVLALEVVEVDGVEAAGPPKAVPNPVSTEPTPPSKLDTCALF